MGFLSRLQNGLMGQGGGGGGGLMGMFPMQMQGHEGAQQQPQGPSMISRFSDAIQSPLVQNGMHMMATGELPSLGQMRQAGQFQQTPNVRPPMMNPGGGIGGGVMQPGMQGQQQLPPPQMPPNPGGMPAMMGAFSTSPEFQSQLGAMHAQQSPGFAAGGAGGWTPPQTTMGQITTPPTGGRRPFGPLQPQGRNNNTGTASLPQPSNPLFDAEGWIQEQYGRQHHRTS